MTGCEAEFAKSAEFDACV